MNITEVKNAFDFIRRSSDAYDRCEADMDLIYQFINEVEHLLQHNSIKQTPALFKPKKEMK